MSRRAQALSLARAVMGRLGRHDLVLLAAGLTFFAMIAVVPLLLVALWATGLLIGSEQLAVLFQRLLAYAPEALGFRDRLASLAEIGSSLSLLAFVAALVPATSYGEGLVRAFDRLAEEESRAKGVRGRLLSLLLLAVLPLLVLTGLAAVATLPDLLGFGPFAQVLGVYLTFLVCWAAATALLAVTYRWFSPVTLDWRPLLWGAASTGSFLSGMSLGWVLVLRFGVSVGRAYGGSALAGQLVLFAIYLYLVQAVCLVGFALTLELVERRRRPQGD